MTFDECIPYLLKYKIIKCATRSLVFDRNHAILCQVETGEPYTLFVSDLTRDDWVVVE